MSRSVAAAAAAAAVGHANASFSKDGDAVCCSAGQAQPGPSQLLTRSLCPTALIEMKNAPYETKSDSFYFVGNKMVMHNKAEYAYTT